MASIREAPSTPVIVKFMHPEYLLTSSPLIYKEPRFDYRPVINLFRRAVT
jgi:hypothetical protein